MYQRQTHSRDTRENVSTRTKTYTAHPTTTALDAWARHATSSNGFGDAFTFDTPDLPFNRS